jgi:hypothetical protein
MLANQLHNQALQYKNHKTKDRLITMILILSKANPNTSTFDSSFQTSTEVGWNHNLLVPVSMTSVPDLKFKTKTIKPF